jgi:hypothetical protein
MGYLQPEGVVERRTRGNTFAESATLLGHERRRRKQKDGFESACHTKLRIVRFLRNSDSHHFLIVRSDRYFRMISNPFGAGG